MNKINLFLTKLAHRIKRIPLTTQTAIIIGSIIIAFSIIISSFIIRENLPAILGEVSPTSNKNIFAGKSVDELDYVEGNTKSNIVVIAYSDPECPYCVSLYPTLKQIRKEYEGKVSFVYRHFPLTQIHSHAFDESRAISCAGIIGGTKKYYEYIDAIYGYKSDHQTNQLTGTTKENLAHAVGIDDTKFASCMSNNQTANEVTESINDGIKAGVQGTPSTFILINNKKGYTISSMVDGARPYEYVKAAIDEALNK